MSPNSETESSAPEEYTAASAAIKSWYKVKCHCSPAVQPVTSGHPQGQSTYTRSPTVTRRGNLREKLIVSLAVLKGIRQKTLSILKYEHVQKDLEANRTPIHIHIDAGEMKGKYCSFDTFAGAEAVEYLKLYLDQRRAGSPYKREGIPMVDHGS